MFIVKFNAADVNENLYLEEDELKKYPFLFRSLEDLPSLRTLLKDETLWKDVINDMSRRHGTKSDHLNFYEWLFIRAVSVAWSTATHDNESITREELLNIGINAMPQ